LIPRESAVPSAREVKQSHVEHEHRVVTPRGTSENSPHGQLGIALEFFGVHSDNFVLPKLAGLRLRHDDAVGRFFDASEGRADDTSFEGRNKSGVPPKRLLESWHARACKKGFSSAAKCRRF
jgi:hypothetical protein